MAQVFGSSWMVLLLVSITVMLLQSQAVQGNGCWYWLFKCCREPEGPAETVSGESDLKDKVIEECQKRVPGDLTRCNNFWSNFIKAFVGKDPENIGLDAYSDLIQSEPITDKTKVLLWSKTYPMIKWLSERDSKHYVHLGNTIYGSLDVPDAVWCGKKGSPDVLTSGCPNYLKHPKNAVSSYWRSVSAAFAKAATGEVTVLLSGAEQEPFNENSILATDELISLQKGKVTALRVILVNKGMKSIDPNFEFSTPPKTCADKSLQDLKSKTSGLNVGYECRSTTE